MPNKELQQAGGNSTPKRGERERVYRTAGRSSLRLLASITLQGESKGIPLSERGAESESKVVFQSRVNE